MPATHEQTMLARIDERTEWIVSKLGSVCDKVDKNEARLTSLEINFFGFKKWVLGGLASLLGVVALLGGLITILQ